MPQLNRSVQTFRSETLHVPGASLYYEVRGSGPVLLMMPGGPADATTFRQIENELASRRTVVTYDPRGLSHSTLESPLDDSKMVEIFADDVHRLLSATADGKASIFGSSGGAIIAFDLVKHHADQLDTVVFHEPPSPALVPNGAEIRAAMENVGHTYRTEGLWPAMNKFMAAAGIQGGPPPTPEGEPSPDELEGMARMQLNMEFFVGRYIPNIARYEPDLAALKSSGCRLVPAVGADSEGQFAHAGGLGLARGLGVKATVFPGGHGGFDDRPAQFAAKLLEVLAHAT